MTAPPAWLTVDDVAAYLDLPDSSDDNLALSTAAVKAAVERRRSDLYVDGVFTPGDEVKGGATIWAASVYQWRNSPGENVTAYGDETSLANGLGSRRGEIMRMLGWRRPVSA